MKDYGAQVEELLKQADDLEHGPTRVSLTEEAVRLADTHSDLDLGFKARLALVHAAQFAGYPETALVAFAWCLAQFDREPRTYDAVLLLWEYKWMLGNLPGFPQISRKQIEEMMADMARRYERAGFSLRPIYRQRTFVAQEMGDRAEATQCARIWHELPRDLLADCPACELGSYIAYLLFMDEDEAAVAQAGPILSGKLQCGQVPHRTLAHLLLPLLRLGRVQEAMKYHRKGYRLIARNRHFLINMAEHLTFVTLTDNLARSIKLFEKHLCWALETVDPADRFRFFLSARFLLDQLQDTGKKSLKLRLPRSFAGYQDSGKYDVVVLLNWFEEAVANLAMRFDGRNGNNYYTRLIAENRKLKELVHPYPLQASRRQPTSQQPEAP